MSTLQQYIERFNPAQREAVENPNGPMLIVAGAGSGKTSVLTARIARLIEQGTDPSRILALTFTKKAADEMRKRIIALSGEGGKGVVMGTFHSVFIRFIRPYAACINFPENFTILDEEDSRACLRRCIDAIIAPGRPPKDSWTAEDEKRYALEDKHYKPTTIMSVISASKNALITPEAYAASSEFALRDRKAQRPLTPLIYRAYRDTCHRSATMDFDDILLYTDMLLANNPDVLALIAGQFDYILVDEYQDTNRAQYSILRRLTWINKNICVVGDDSQSIYAFRGARIENIINFNKDYSGCKVVKLEQNYRSTKNIVGAANNLITRNEGRIPKVCFTDSEKGETISLRSCKDEAEEAAFVASTILNTIENEKGKELSWKDFAVLYRTNSQSRAIEDTLVKNGIPYVIYSGTSFFERMEVKDLMAYFRLAVNPDDDEAFLRVVNKPRRAFAKAAQDRLCDIARQWGMSLYSAATNAAIDACGFQPRQLAGLKAFTRLIGEFREKALSSDALETAMHISDSPEVDFLRTYLTAGDDESLKRADNIQELINSVKHYLDEAEAEKDSEEGNAPTATMSDYLQNVMLMSNADTQADKDDCVSLMTVHCAKGLEYDTVFVTGMEKNLFPLEIDKTRFEEEEERRLFYVAITRAKRKLFLTNAKSRLRFGQKTAMKPSHFLEEIRHPKQ